MHLQFALLLIPITTTQSFDTLEHLVSFLQITTAIILPDSLLFLINLITHPILILLIIQLLRIPAAILMTISCMYAHHMSIVRTISSGVQMALICVLAKLIVM